MTVPCFFFRVGLCSHAFLLCCTRGSIAGGQRRSQGIDRVDPSPRDHWLSTCAKSDLSDAIDGRHVASRGGVNLHRTVAIHRNFGISEGDTWTHLNRRGRSDSGDASRLMIVAHDRSSIVAWSPHDRGQITMWFRPRSPLSGGPWSSCHLGHQISLSTGSNDPKIAWKFSFKNRCTPLFLLNSWLNREGIKQFERQILSSSWSPRV